MSAGPLVRRLFVWVAALAVVGLGWVVFGRLAGAGLQVPLDFAEYYTAGHLNVVGSNPYDGGEVRRFQQSLGLQDTAIMMWNPPWTLTLVMPVGALPLETAYGLWVLLNFGLMILAAELLWRGFGGPAGGRGVAYFLALSFVPTIFLIGSGQITAFVLVGLAGFLAAARSGRWGVAGAVGALTAVKPHLLGLFALMLILDAFRTRAGRRVVLAGAVVGLLACIPPTLANPEVWAQYHAATTGGDSADHHGLAHWGPPLAGWWLRTGFALPFAAQFLPFAVAAVGFVVWYWRQPPTDAANVADRLPAVVGLSLLAAPYGVWQFDLVLLLVPVLATAAHLARRPNPTGTAVGIAVLLAANAVGLAMMLAGAESKWYVWFAPVVLAGCWASCSAACGSAACTPGRKWRSPEPTTTVPT
jgi:hypothetical protein